MAWVQSAQHGVEAQRGEQGVRCQSSRVAPSIILHLMEKRLVGDAV